MDYFLQPEYASSSAC